MLNKKLILIAILLLSFLFRFWNLQNFQLWSSDEEIAAAVVRKITVEHRPPLVIPNSILAVSFGPYFHYLSSILFFATNSNPQAILALMGLVGVATTLIIYKICIDVSNTKLATTAAFLYSTSFVMGLWDRRWWPLSLNQIIAAVSIYSMYKIYKGKPMFLAPFTIGVGFALHADPSIAVCAFAFIASLFALKLKLTKKSIATSFLISGMFLLPLILFELRHPGAVSSPILASFQKNTKAYGIESTSRIDNLAYNSTTIFAHMLTPKSSPTAENYVATGFTNYTSKFPFKISAILILFLLTWPAFMVIKRWVSTDERALIIICYSFLITFYAGIIVYTSAFNKPSNQSYFTITFVPFFILVAYTVVRTFKNTLALVGILLIFLTFNLHALLNSSFKYPLNKKIEIVQNATKSLSTDNFSLYTEGDGHVEGGGFLGLFILENKHPKKSNVYDHFDWIYRAYSLYTISPSDTEQDEVVIISTNRNIYPKEKIATTKNFDNITLTILDNRDRSYKR